jgi:hypothetical protein
LKNVFKITVTALVLFFGTAKAQNISGHFLAKTPGCPIQLVTQMRVPILHVS